jgi:hypothetical protein
MTAMLEERKGAKKTRCIIINMVTWLSDKGDFKNSLLIHEILRFATYNRVQQYNCKALGRARMYSVWNTGWEGLSWHKCSVSFSAETIQITRKYNFRNLVFFWSSTTSTTGSFPWDSPPKFCVYFLLLYACYVSLNSHPSLFKYLYEVTWILQIALGRFLHHSYLWMYSNTGTVPCIQLT